MKPGKKGHFITSRVEHPAVVRVFQYLEEQGHDVSLIPVDEAGIVSLDELTRELREDTCLVSIQAREQRGWCYPAHQRNRRNIKGPSGIVPH